MTTKRISKAELEYTRDRVRSTVRQKIKDFYDKNPIPKEICPELTGMELLELTLSGELTLPKGKTIEKIKVQRYSEFSRVIEELKIPDSVLREKEKQIANNKKDRSVQHKKQETYFKMIKAEENYILDQLILGDSSQALDLINRIESFTNKA